MALFKLVIKTCPARYLRGLSVGSRSLFLLLCTQDIQNSHSKRLPHFLIFMLVSSSILCTNRLSTKCRNALRPFQKTENVGRPNEEKRWEIIKRGPKKVPCCVSSLLAFSNIWILFSSLLKSFPESPRHRSPPHWAAQYPSDGLRMARRLQISQKDACRF